MSRNPPTRSRILMVHPDPLVRGTVVSVAAMLGMGFIEEADAASSAQCLLQTVPFDGVVLDLDEGAPALQLLAGLRAGEYCSPRTTPVLITCGMNSAAVVEQLGRLAPVELLVQPFRVKSLLLRLQVLPQIQLT